MSGGVDSSVAACLLVEQGYEVLGLFMRSGVKAAEVRSLRPSPLKGEGVLGLDLKVEVCTTARTEATVAPRPHQGCCSASDAADARFVAGKLGIPFYSLNFEAEFDELIDHIVDEYARGRTPNPCIVCNNKLKFGKIVEYADAVGAQYIATGHYARIERGDDGASSGMQEPSPLPSPWEGEGVRAPRSKLLRGVDAAKDQSYVLFGVDRRVLDRVLLPVGHFTKPQVREIAARYDLPNRNKPDSVEICFVPDRNYARLVRERRPEAFAAGEVVESGTG
ncbi:MAG: MnmA/TRMU family protein, partial [Thermoplasmata archaeon]